MATRAETISNLNRCYDELEELIAGLAEADWKVQSLCPDWNIRGVVTHSAGIENALIGWNPTGADDPPPFDKIPPFVAESKGWSSEELVARVRSILDRRREELAAATDEDFARPCGTPVGPATYHRFMDIRVFDLWVHQRDMTYPLGRATDDAGPAAEMSLDEVHNSIGFIVGKKVGLPDGHSIAFDLTGPLERTIYAKVDGRATKVDHLDDPTVTVTSDSTTFIQLACGRIDPQAVIDEGRISWTGDPVWGDKAARSLRFTM
ncbi:MAG: maleylpyruvate isomerase family mycothiol-dependent enzyme [Acidimicrobiales bacterium]